MKRIILLTALFFISTAALATTTLSLEQQARAKSLGQQLRCPVCRGVPISESPAELAIQMMSLVKEQVAAGKTDEEILRYFEERYGEWALLKPKAHGMNLIIWVLPAFFLIAGSLFIIIHYKRKG